MDRKLINYLPPVLRDVTEFKAINDANEPEISLAWDGLDWVMANQFLDDADERGVSVWEQELKIHPKDTDTLAVRKARVKALWNRELPYTVPWLKNWLQGLCGPQGFEVAIVDYSIHIQLDYTILLDAALIAEQITDLLLAVRPSNMWLLLISFVQSEGTVQMGALTERSVYMDVWPMLVNELESAGGIKMAGPLEYHATVEIYPYKEDIENA